MTVFTHQTDPELAGLFHDLFDPAAFVFAQAKLLIPEDRRAEIEEAILGGQPHVVIPHPGGRATAAVYGKPNVMLGSANVEPDYQARIEQFVDVALSKLENGPRLRELHRAGRCGLMVLVLVEEERVRLVALLENDPAQWVALVELTGVRQTVVH
jgi:hypothetical protein